MTDGVTMMLFAVAVGWLGPRVLAQGTWVDANPAVGLVLWLAVLWSAITAFIAGLFALTLDIPYLRDVAADLMRACAATFHQHYENHPAAATVALIVLVLGGLGLLVHVLRAWQQRRSFLRRHRRALDIVARPDPRWGGVWLLEHPTPTAYSLPGRPGRVVISSGTLAALRHAEMAAVIAHERAHLRGRHHLVAAVTRTCATACPFLPVARKAPLVVGYLLERLADEVACRQHDPSSLAAALAKMAHGDRPSFVALAASGDAVGRRLQWLGDRPSSARTPALVVGYAASVVIIAAPLVTLIAFSSSVAFADHCLLPPPFAV